MEHTILGRTGRRVSRLGYGGAPAGLRNYIQTYDPDRSGDAEAIVAAIRRAVEQGVTYFDTAAGYGGGRSERVFGEALSGLDPGEALFVATKAGVGDVASMR